ncbi:hypothetical protein [Chryseobacterium wanjuense]
MKDFKNILQEKFSKTGDSELISYLYKNGKISLDVRLEENDILNMQFETEILYSKNIEQRAPFNIGYFECIKLSDVLKIENNHYSFSGSFVDIMKAQRNKINLVFGLPVSNYTHLITFSNNSVNLAFVINEKNNYKFDIK